MVGCTERGVVWDFGKTFFKPIITPFELELALEGYGGDKESKMLSVENRYVLDFDKLLVDKPLQGNSLQ